jgi:hypothetical protein
MREKMNIYSAGWGILLEIVREDRIVLNDRGLRRFAVLWCYMTCSDTAGRSTVTHTSMQFY